MAGIDRNSPLPVYFQIAVDLRRRIQAGEWGVGERIASEVALATHYAVSRVTVRQALSELAKDDLVERHRGSGTFVRGQPRPLMWDLNLTVGDYASRLGEMGFVNAANVLEARLIRDPPADLTERLQVAPGSTVTYLLRRLLINGEPAAIYRSWFTTDMVPSLESSPHLDGSLSALLLDSYGLVPDYNVSCLEVIRATAEEAAIIDTNVDAPLLLIATTTYLADDRPLEYAQLACLGDRVRFHVKGIRNPARGGAAAAAPLGRVAGV